MSKSRCRELTEQGDRLFDKRGSLHSHWQDVAEHFHPERADFTTERVFGDDFAAHLMTGFPALQLRELADQLAAMLRPRQRPWNKLVASNERTNEDPSARQWLESKTEVMRQAMYSRDAQFLRATKTGDKDFVSFGQAVIQPSMNTALDGLLYRCWHLRDVAWCEDADQKIDTVHRKEKMTARLIVEKFPGKAHAAVKKCAEDDPYKEFNCRVIVVPADQYETEKKYNKARTPFVEIILDCDNDTILSEKPQRRLGYVIPRWNLGAMGQYATSPATMLALPDSRLLQQMTVSLLEAAEKGANPPMVATMEAVRSDMQLFAGGVTWVDREYDEKLGEALRPIAQDMRGMQYGVQMLEGIQEQIKAIFYLNKINLPEIGKDMTAFEVQKRVEEYVRGALPLFEPMEVEYNGAICEETFNLLLDNGGFGSPEEFPDVLRGADVRFEFESPLQQTSERAKAQAFQEAAGLVSMVREIDPDAIEVLDIRKAFSDALDGVQVPADWKRDPKYVEQMIAFKQQQRAQQQQMAEVGAGAEMAGKAAPMIAALNQAGAAGA